MMFFEQVNIKNRQKRNTRRHVVSAAASNRKRCYLRRFLCRTKNGESGGIWHWQRHRRGEVALELDIGYDSTEQTWEVIVKICQDNGEA